MTTETVVVNQPPDMDKETPYTGRAKAKLRTFARHTMFVLTAFVVVYPILWMIASSLRPQSEIFANAGLLVTDPQWENYELGWNSLAEPFGRYLLNSGILVLGSIVGNLISCSMAAYAFARLRFRGRKVAFAIMLGTIMLPIHVIIVPQYIMFSELDLLNTFWPLILPKALATDSFFVFLMVQFIRGLPRDLDEAARLDGCGHVQIFGRVILPLMVPALATTAVFTFIWVWNDFFSQLVYLTDADMFTAPIALSTFVDSSSSTTWGPLFAMSAVSLVPLFGAFLLGQRFLVKGVATTGLK